MHPSVEFSQPTFALVLVLAQAPNEINLGQGLNICYVTGRYNLRAVRLKEREGKAGKISYKVSHTFWPRWLLGSMVCLC